MHHTQNTTTHLTEMLHFNGKFTQNNVVQWCQTFHTAVVDMLEWE